MADLFRTLIIRAADAPAARQIAAAFGPGGIGMWTTPLSASGTDPATHYISSGYIPAEFVSLVPNTRWNINDNGQWIIVYSYAGDANAVSRYATAAGLSITDIEVQDIYNRSDCSEQDPHVAINRLGLKLVQPNFL